MQIELNSKSSHLLRWFDAHRTGLRIMRRCYYIMEQTPASQKEIENTPGKCLLPAIALSSLCKCQPRCAKTFARGSRYDSQQIVRAVVLLG